MKSLLWTIAAALAVGSILASSIPAGAQIHPATARPYRLVDFGTLGGPISYFSGFQPAMMMNSYGTVIGLSETTAADVHPSSCWDPDCHQAHAFSGDSSGSVTDLGALPGPNSSQTDAINDRGVIVGQSQNAKIDPITSQPAAVAVFWRAGRIHGLRGLGGTQSFAMGINNQGTMVGWALNKTPYTTSIWGNLGTEQRAVLWSPGGKVLKLGTLGGPAAVAYLINSHGAVTGQAQTTGVVNAVTGSPTTDPFLWRSGHMRDLGTLGGSNGSPAALNDRGQVAGQSDLKGDTSYHAFFWSRGTAMRDLGTLGGPDSYSTWLNTSGHVIGQADLAALCSSCGGAHVHHAFVWSKGKMIDIGVLKKSMCSRSVGINSKDQVVGESTTVCGTDDERNLTGFLWQAGHMADLNTLISHPASGLHIAEADAINNQGDIAGIGVLPNGDEHVVLLVPRR